ncbi:hypothetical protein L3X38_025072 [Prunus dulcis]|uniref:Uncharacterized protein n=1 Tax=Prunus dulcis TaxID=3755 RepID=A0AAD4W2L1_PRUDU|nr:hypothetical protein L3X38_025072 [Prunus dulcis]
MRGGTCSIGPHLASLCTHVGPAVGSAVPSGRWPGWLLCWFSGACSSNSIRGHSSTDRFVYFAYSPSFGDSLFADLGHDARIRDRQSALRWYRGRFWTLLCDQVEELLHIRKGDLIFREQGDDRMVGLLDLAESVPDATYLPFDHGPHGFYPAESDENIPLLMDLLRGVVESNVAGLRHVCGKPFSLRIGIVPPVSCSWNPWWPSSGLFISFPGCQSAAPRGVHFGFE